MMILVVGLGNPGKEYAKNRHNAGFMLVDEMIKDGGYVDVSSTKFRGQLYKKGSLLLLKPLTYMNLSGSCVRAVSDFYKPENIIVAHDDLDIAFGGLKFKRGGSSGGHNGIKSIDEHMGADYDRVRIGIGHPDKNMVKNYVLSDFDESDRLVEILKFAKEGLLELIKTGDLKAVSAKHTRKKGFEI